MRPPLSDIDILQWYWSMSAAIVVDKNENILTLLQGTNTFFFFFFFKSHQFPYRLFLPIMSTNFLIGSIGRYHHRGVIMFLHGKDMKNNLIKIAANGIDNAVAMWRKLLQRYNHKPEVAPLNWENSSGLSLG